MALVQCAPSMQTKFPCIWFGCFNSGQLPARLIFMQGCIMQSSPVTTLKETRLHEMMPRHLSSSCKMIEINKAN